MTKKFFKLVETFTMNYNDSTVNTPKDGWRVYGRNVIKRHNINKKIVL